ncbi:MAG: type II toxin-antitoxin system VapC family toxin [Devosia sp.]
MILADTSVWIDHLRIRDPTLERLMEAIELLMHPFVLGELALGSLHRREAKLMEWRKLPMAAVPRHDDILELIARNELFGRGIGYIDATLLASAMAMQGTKLWTRDRRLAAVAVEMKVAARLDN